ncbi:hypothetical protein CICLE_v10017418mg [Citrus x clementina]|uniref:Uncharacterized protein n=1 Tax=Citrus clementina TaxID=85681 RepID=V4UHF0_CITCL|nr:hypothetical protein CICLE_v10017418mg [Citrus x clementina]
MCHSLRQRHQLISSARRSPCSGFQSPCTLLQLIRQIIQSHRHFSSSSKDSPSVDNEIQLSGFFVFS